MTAQHSNQMQASKVLKAVTCFKQGTFKKTEGRMTQFISTTTLYITEKPCSGMMRVFTDTGQEFRRATHNKIQEICTIIFLFIYLWFYIAFNTVQVISRLVVGRAEKTSIVHFLYCVFILSAISPYYTGLKPQLNQSACTSTAPTHK